MNSPTCVAVPPLLHPSTSSRSGGQIPREWQTPGTCTGREPTSTPTSQTMGSPGKTLCSVCQHQGAAGESLERGKHPGHSTMGALHRAGELSPSPLPSLRLCSQSPNPHYLPKIQLKGTDQPQPCSLRQQLHFPQPWEGAKPGTEGQHSPGSHPAAAATDSNNEMAALSTTLNKCHTLFLA